MFARSSRSFIGPSTGFRSFADTVEFSTFFHKIEIFGSGVDSQTGANLLPRVPKKWGGTCLIFFLVPQRQALIQYRKKPKNILDLFFGSSKVGLGLVPKEPEIQTTDSRFQTPDFRFQTSDWESEFLVHQLLNQILFSRNQTKRLKLFLRFQVLNQSLTSRNQKKLRIVLGWQVSN